MYIESLEIKRMTYLSVTAFNSITVSSNCLSGVSAVDCGDMFTRKLIFPEPILHEKKFSSRADAENKLSVQTKFDSLTAPPISESIGRLLTLCSKGPKYNR